MHGIVPILQAVGNADKCRKLAQREWPVAVEFRAPFNRAENLHGLQLLSSASNLHMNYNSYIGQISRWFDMAIERAN